MTLRRAACAFGVVLAAPVAAAAGPAPADPVECAATLVVHLAAGRSTYSVGELILRELEFRGQAEPWTGSRRLARPRSLPRIHADRSGSARVASGRCLEHRPV